MSRKAKATGCGRFFIVMIILVPIAFVGASLYNGENPLDALTKIFGGEVTVVEDQIKQDEADIAKEIQSENPPVIPQGDSALQVLQEDVAAKDRMIQRLESQIGLLEEELDKCQAELQKTNK